ncbi:MAG: hypothetical protein ACREEE_07240 [Dongiaceae bacterium]
MRLARAFLAIAFIAAIGGCSDKNKADVEKIKQDITTELAELAGPEKGRFFTHDGVEVVPDGEGFDVKVAGVRLIPDEQQSLALGTVEFHLVAKGEDQYDISELKLPSSLTFKEPSGGEAKLEYGEQQFKGLWSKSLNTFLSMDATYKAIKLVDSTGSEAMIDEMTASRVSTDKGGGLWDQTTKGVAKNLRIKDVQGTMTMANVDMANETHGMKLVELQMLQQKFSQLMFTSAAGQQPDPALLQELRAYQNWFADSNGRMDMSGMSFTDTAGATTFALDHFIVEAAATGMDQPKGNVRFGFLTLGLKIPASDSDPTMAGFRQFIPSKFNMGFALDDVPPGEIWGAMVDMFGSMDFSQQNPEQANAAAQAFGFQLLQMLQSAGSTFRMTGWEIETPASQFKLEGSVKPNGNSPFGAIANISTEISGLDAVIDGVVATLGEAGAAEIMAVVPILHQYSNRETAADGRIIDRYAIDLAETGEVTVNGKPLDIMGAMMGMPQ